MTQLSLYLWALSLVVLVVAFALLARRGRRLDRKVARTARESLHFIGSVVEKRSKQTQGG